MAEERNGTRSAGDRELGGRNVTVENVLESFAKPPTISLSTFFCRLITSFTSEPVKDTYSFFGFC